MTWSARRWLRSVSHWGIGEGLTIVAVAHDVVDGDDERAVAQQGQGQVEPGMAVLEVDDVRSESAHLPHHAQAVAHLSQRLADAWPIEGPEVHRRVELLQVPLRQVIRQQQQDVVLGRQGAGEANAVLAKVEGDQGDSHRVTATGVAPATRS